MKLNSVRLKNIRSYEDARVDFDEGITLLSGDIGSGKTSILLAIEFAVFGIMRGGLSGGQLLRHDASNGFVELDFELEGKKVVVKRGLKRTKDSVSQEAGSVVVNGVEETGTPVEIKSKILDMIGYPDELVSKSKNSLFRYTVYTPQESMKTILLEGEEARLDTLRRIFNIDKYKRIRENSALLMRELRSEQKILQARIEGKQELSDKIGEKEDQKKAVREGKGKVEGQIKGLKKALDDVKNSIVKYEKETEEYRKQKSEVEILKNSVNDKEQRLEKIVVEVKEATNEVSVIEEELKKNAFDNSALIEQNTRKIKEVIEKGEEKMVSVREEEATLKAKQDQAEELKQKVSELDKCPVCLQEVTPEHAASVVSKQNEKLEKIKKAMQQRVDFKAKLQVKMNEFGSRLEKLREQEKLVVAIQEKANSLREKKSRQEKLEQEKLDVESRVKKLKNDLLKLEQKTVDSGVAKKLEEAKEEYENKRSEMTRLEVSKAESSKEIESIEEAIEEIKERMKEVLKKEEKLKASKEYLGWLEDYFVKVVGVMEKRVMLKIYGEFNEYFKEWFNTLMEDETMSVRLDEKFSPIIVQDGYETMIENLSGGEKTSVALAYRLSLNKVINDFITTIKTRDLIILDEPTDGFSSEQLDRVREVLKQLDIKQVLIVSHESKMESYADHVIRVEKQNHVSVKA